MWFYVLWNTVDSGYNEPSFSELPAIVNATLGIRMFSHKTVIHFLSGYNEPAYNELPDKVNRIL
jgi:hypothetical protein